MSDKPERFRSARPAGADAKNDAVFNQLGGTRIPGTTGLKVAPAHSSLAGQFSQVPSVTLRYEAVDGDLISQTARFKEAASKSKTLAIHAGMLVVHGNNRIILQKGGVDVSKKYRTYRVWRVWSASLDPKTGETTAPYTTGGSTAFTIDTADSGSSWVDVPGQQVLGERKPERILMEFLVGVEDHPEFGGLLFIVVLDITPTRYRVRMYKEVQFTSQGWTEVFPKGFSKSNERLAVALPTWKPAGPENEYRLALDYGWQDFPK